MAQQTAASIAAEKAALTKAESSIVDLQASRSAALLADDHKIVDSADTSIAAAQKAINRSRERIELLETQLKIESAASTAAELDKLAAKADRARKDGEKIIADYAQDAAVLRAMLQKLAHIDEQIALANRALEKAGRAVIPSPNAIRTKSAVSVAKTERRRLGIGNPEHPMHKLAKIDRNGQARHIETGAYIETFGEFDVPVSHRESGYYPDPLQTSVILPRVDPNADDFWPRAPGCAAPESPGIVGSLLAAFSPRAA